MIIPLPNETEESYFKGVKFYGQNAFKDAKLISKNQIYNLHFHDVWRSHNINKYINDGYRVLLSKSFCFRN